MNYALSKKTEASAFAIHYLKTSELADYLSAAGGSVLGVIGFGADRPAALPEACPFAAALLPTATPEAAFEVWSGPSTARYHQVGSVVGACAGDFAFGVLEPDEAAAGSFEELAEKAYLDIFDFLDATGHGSPLRFWNYLPWITADDNGLERYRRFNIGRYNAFSARLASPLPPAASAVGSRSGSPLIYFLAGREPPRAIENPRQVSAYAYPPIYGPRSPGFSRASLVGTGDAASLLISGTASIVGHESLHLDDPAAQIAETLDNIAALIGEAERNGFTGQSGRWAFKIYLRDPAYRDMVQSAIDTVFGEDCERLYLRADMCRSELLVEIEAVCLQSGLGVRTVRGAG